MAERTVEASSNTVSATKVSLGGATSTKSVQPSIPRHMSNGRI
ncbi:hypothetical protein [Galbibacter sp. PAP.153]